MIYGIIPDDPCGALRVVASLSRGIAASQPPAWRGGSQPVSETERSETRHRRKAPENAPDGALEGKERSDAVRAPRSASDEG